MSGLREEVPLPRRLHRRRPVLVLKMGNGWAVPTQTPVNPSGQFPKTSKICPFSAAPSINMDNQDSRGPARLKINFQGTSRRERFSPPSTAADFQPRLRLSEPFP